MPRPQAKRRHNLPAHRVRLIGREQDLVVARQALLGADGRLLTLTGMGGCGKTRLALQLAADLVATFPDGVWLVELAGIADAALVPPALVATLGVRERPGEPLVATLVRTLARRELLLVLDNCEHVIDVCAQVVEDLLDHCPRLRVLATSREALRIPGERAWRVPSLAVPEPNVGLEDLLHVPAVQLFVERARAVQPEFELRSANASAVAGICARLDGLPLALELAAALVSALSAPQILERLDDRFRLLVGGSRTAPTRQHTLRATLDWSHSLLTSGEQTVVRRLAVFAGGCSLPAAEAVCSDRDLPADHILDILSRLVDKSLVIMEEQEGQARYRLLETLRQYALERLDASGETDTARRQHVEHFLALAEQAEPELEGAQQRRWVALLEAELDNLRAALRWCVERDEVNQGLRLAAALPGFWLMRGHLREGRDWCAELLRLPGVELASGPRAVALNGAGQLAIRQGDYAAARALIEESLAISEGSGDRRGVARSLNLLGLCADDQGDYTAARSLHKRSLAIRRELGERSGVAHSLKNLGLTVTNQGDHPLASSLVEESLSLLRDMADLRGVATALNILGLVADRQGKYGVAHARYAESLTISRELGDRDHVSWSLQGLSAVAAAQGQAKRALRLDAASTRLREALGEPLSAVEREPFQRQLESARRTLNAQERAAAWAEGHAMPLQRAIDYALAASAPPLGPATRTLQVAPDFFGGLTPRQLEVAVLVAQGLTNRQIGERLVVTEAAAAKHVEHILNKLGVGTRAQVAAWVAERGLLPTRAD